MADLQAHHFGIIVEDIEESLSFYRDTLGLEVAAEFTLDGDGIATAIDVEGVTGRFAHLDAGGARIELIEYEPAGETARAEAVNQLGAKHAGFEVDDIDAFYADLPDSASPIAEPQRSQSGARILFFEDPDGNILEVIST
ncbi:VOC family protein [Halopenitus sp. H-Gu1]|uniref:VOC family protein n=1 Tax=Halopenitus sp. H-Gu1 TaxID=3242697 RepID=UPI00359D0453